MQKTLELHIDPSPHIARRFLAWRAETKAKLEAAGVTITDINGTTFIGHYDPATVDLNSIDL